MRLMQHFVQLRVLRMHECTHVIEQTGMSCGMQQHSADVLRKWKSDSDNKTIHVENLQVNFFALKHCGYLYSLFGSSVASIKWLLVFLRFTHHLPGLLAVNTGVIVR